MCVCLCVCVCVCVCALSRLPLLEMDLAIRVQILDDTVYISHNANSLGKGMHLPFLL